MVTKSFFASNQRSFYFLKGSKLSRLNPSQDFRTLKSKIIRLFKFIFFSELERRNMFPLEIHLILSRAIWIHFQDIKI